MSVIIRLQNLPISANASNIRRFFGGLSIPEGGVHIVGGNEGDAFIAFATDEDARKAMLLDRQSINNAPVRLFLSSKAEMQSIIESARSSALFSGAPVSSLPQPTPQKTETMSALDVTAPTLPSSFPSYRNGAVREPASHDVADNYSYMYPKSTNPLPDNPSRPLPKVADDYSSDNPMIQPRLGRSHNDVHDRGYGYGSQQTLPAPRYDDVRNVDPLRGDFNSNRDSFSDRDPSGYKSYYDDYEYNRRPFPEDQFVPRPKDVDRESPRDHYPGNFPTRQANEELPREYGSYPRMPSPRTFPDRCPPSEAPRDTARPNAPSYPPETRNFPSRPPECDSFPPGLPEERDFSVRPPWLNEDALPPASKRPYQMNAPDFEDFQPKRKPLPPPALKPNTEPSLSDNGFVIRVSIPIAEVGIRAAFEILRGVHIVPKWGIRIEEDSLQRPTGYVFIMTTTRDSYDRALSYDNRPYRGDLIRITPSSLDEFYHVSDPNFINKCPPDMAKKLPAPDQCCPPHHSDGCLELTELPADTTKGEVVRFLGAPGLTVDNVVITRYPPSDKTAPRSDAIRALVTLPSVNDIKILLSAKPRPFRQGSPLPPARLTPISKLQLLAYSTFDVDRSSERPPRRLPEPTAPQVINDSSPTTNKIAEVLNCAFLSGFSRFVRDSEVLHLFPSIIIPGDAIRMGPDNTSAYVDFISENNCRRAIAEVSNENSKAKSLHPSLKIEAISRKEMESRLGLDSKSGEQPSSDRANRPRDSRNQWDSRPSRPNQASFDNRPAAPGRPAFDDPYYERPAPQHFDEFPRPRRGLPPVDVPPGGPTQHADAPRPGIQPPPGPPRRPGFDIVTVFVGNLPQNINVDQLAGIFRDYFFIPGSIRLRRDPQGQPMGEALVDFKSSYEADRALRALNGFRVGNRPIVLRYDHRC